MRRKVVWLVVSCLMVLALLATSCAKAEEKAPAVKEAAPVVKEAAPVVKEAAPAVKEAAPAAGAEMVKVTLTKLDGTKIEKLVEKPRYGGSPRIGLGNVVMGWDEAYRPPWTVSSTIENINDELLEGDWARGAAGTGEVTWGAGGWLSMPYTRGALAESWEFPDDQTVIYHIRKGVKWALNPNSAASRLVNGREFTADDVVFNLKRIFMEIKTSSAYGQLGAAAAPTEIYAPDKYTVVVKVPKGHTARAWEDLGMLCRMYPPEVVKKYGDMNQWENSVGTGPFMVVDYVPMSSVTFVSNPNHWRKDPVHPDNQLPYLDGYKIVVMPDVSTQLAALRTAKIDSFYSNFPWTDVKSLIQSNPNVQYKGSLMTAEALGGRLDRPELPWGGYDQKALKVRRALAMGFNNQEALDIYEGKGEILALYVPPTPEWEGIYTPLGKLPPSADGFDNNKLYGYYPEEAKKLLAEAGYPNGFKAEVVTNAATADVLSVFKFNWAKIGVDLKLDMKEMAVSENMFYERTHKEMHYHGVVVHAPYVGYLIYGKNTFNWSMVDDPRINSMYEELGTLYYDPPKRAALLKKINQYAIEQAYYYQFPAPYKYYVWQPWLKNYHGESDVSYFSYNGWIKWAWYDEELKKAMGY